jgi:hypothetical protein
MIEPAFVRYEPRFVEDCIFLAVRGRPEEKLYHRERNRHYEIADPQERERAFQNLNQGWFMRLGLTDPIEKAVSEQPHLRSRIGYCLVARAPGKKEEGAELFVDSQEGSGTGEKSAAGIFLRPQSLLDSAKLLTFLRHELLHITDMLDPSFGYEPALPMAEGGPTHDRLLNERYRVLWDTTIDGRMVHWGWAEEKVRDERLGDFNRFFPMLGDETVQAFRRFFERESHTHTELVAFARNPRASIGSSQMRSYPGSRCPLCGFPTYAFTPEPESMPGQVITLIVQDFPHWHPSQGLCLQCADLYGAEIGANSKPRIAPSSSSHSQNSALFDRPEIRVFQQPLGPNLR